MKDPTIEFKKIYEHDIDLLIIEEFISDCGFAKIFLDKLQLSDEYNIEKASHSLADADGESDVVFVLRYPDKKVALLVEDKIDAQTMPQQSERYYKRAEKAKKTGEYDAFYIILVAPEEYHKEHKNDSNAVYEYRVCYEELLGYLNLQKNARARYKAKMIEYALQEKKSGYQVVVSPAVTEFWAKLRKYCKENYPKLDMLGDDGPKGVSARWPEFKTAFGTSKVIFKSQKGCVDLEFPQYGNKVGDLLKKVGVYMSNEMLIEATGKSASIRIKNEKWVLDFIKDFDTYIDIVPDILDAVTVLCEFAARLNYSEIY